ncbi:hypothetical protein ACE38W_14310 [Chitinophaga sp. Hz27]|uniref:hypothetical protein n=1 Tax=Chitinophaga sp. Hz27 TaxID=3347169 RepID=UPI0035E177AD
MLRLIKKIFISKSAQANSKPANGESPIAEDFIWCLVGNIEGEHVNAAGKTVYGIKHFSPGTKVYCFPVRWGDGYEKIYVLGKHRKTARNILIVIPSKHIRNWRLKKVYHPHILEIMRKERGWKNRDEDKLIIEEMAKDLNQQYPVA